MTELVFLLEESSAEEMLRGLLPRVIPADVAMRFIPFNGKQDMERKLVRKLQSYRMPDARFVVMRDQDAEPDCTKIKRRLADLCKKAGRPSTLVRIACKELESFYLADLQAVEQGLGVSGIAKRQQESKYRDPDQVVSPKQELRRLTKDVYQPRSGSRAIGPHLDPANKRSRSFRNLVLGIRRLVEGAKDDSKAL